MIRLVNYAARFTVRKVGPQRTGHIDCIGLSVVIKSHVRALAVGRCMIKSER
jgi:hypothetical protein